jgi:catechol 2,3-dioxygenase-like lactoylglutathione lyase family enzyme
MEFFCVGVTVSDRRRSVAWYTEKLGLEVVQDMGHWVTVGRKGGSGLIHLCETTSESPNDPNRGLLELS